MNAIDIPRAGEVWRSRDRRDDGLSVRIRAVDNDYVYIQRFRRTKVRLARFHKDYMRVSATNRSDDD